MTFRLSEHAKEELTRRQIPLSLVEQVLDKPQQTVAELGDLKAYQSQFDFGDGKMYLLRVIVADDREPPLVITVYRTRRISRYWRAE